MREVVDAAILQANLVHLSHEPLSQLTQTFVTESRQLLMRQGFAMSPASRSVQARSIPAGCPPAP